MPKEIEYSHIRLVYKDEGGERIRSRRLARLAGRVLNLKKVFSVPTSKMRIIGCVYNIMSSLAMMYRMNRRGSRIKEMRDVFIEVRKFISCYRKIRMSHHMINLEMVRIISRIFKGIVSTVNHLYNSKHRR